MRIRFITMEMNCSPFLTINSEDYEKGGQLSFMSASDNPVAFITLYNSKIWGTPELTVCYERIPDKLIQVSSDIWTSYSRNNGTIIWQKPQSEIDTPEKLIIGDTL